ncbi:MAG: efflux RND transporter periplasmic adaptor subunit [Chloroflexi bacterium]|nr:efflux RND transporter periplasmic adaptor subunit [Chloroflexota bacterium]
MKGLWLIVGIAVAGVVATGVGFQGYSVAFGAGRTDQARQLAVVMPGDLVTSVSASGGLSFSNQRTLSFGSAGTVVQVLVREGDVVREGQVVARLDAATIASLQKTVAQARVALDNAQEALADLKAGPTAQALAVAEAAVANARLSLRNAEEANQRLLDGPDADAVANAEATVGNAIVALENARRDQTIVVASWATTIPNAEDQVETAGEKYGDFFSRYLGIALTDGQLLRPPQELLDKWGADLNVLLGPGTYGSELRKREFGILPVDDPATPWNEMVLFAWVALSPLRPDTAALETEIDALWEALEKARENLAAQGTQRDKALASAQNAADKAAVALKTAQEALADLTVPADPLDLEAKAVQVTVSQANLEATLKSLNETRQGPDALAIALKEAEVASAQAALDDALDRLDRAVLKASFAGVMGTVQAKEEQTIGANASVATLIDPTAMEVRGTLDEVDVASVRPGQEVSVAVDAVSGLSLQGRVATVSSVGQSQQGIVTYPFVIAVEVPRQAALREGMTVTATITLQRVPDVFLVPRRALRGSLASPTVVVLEKGIETSRPVTVAGSNDQYIAVLDGLKAGEVVVVPTAASGLATSSSPAGQRGFQSGGGLPGGGAFRVFQDGGR